MSTMIDFPIAELGCLRKYPSSLTFQGELSLLRQRKISIVGSRKPDVYTQHILHRLSAGLARLGMVIVSGGAMGCDAIAHRAAGPANTIAVLPCGINVRYPAINRYLLEDIGKHGLLISQFEENAKATKWSFVVRNEIVVALGEILVIAQADLNSGSMRSAELAMEMGKPIYVLPHRIGESEGTNRLLAEGKAEAIYDIDAFLERYRTRETVDDLEDPFWSFCSTMPTFEAAKAKFGERLFEAELEGRIEIRNGKVLVVR